MKGEDSAGRPRSERGHGGEPFARDVAEDGDGEEVAFQHLDDDGVAVAADLGDVDGDHSDREAAQGEARNERQPQRDEEALGVFQRGEEHRREDAGDDAQARVGDHLERGRLGERRHAVEHVGRGQHVQREGGGDGRNHEGTEAFHRDRAEDDLGDEEGARDRGVVG
jgi:hypothetical protein